MQLHFMVSESDGALYDTRAKDWHKRTPLRAIETARDAFAGSGYDTPADYAAELLEDTGQLVDVPESLRNYIDFESFARDLGFDGYVFARHNGEIWVFAPC